jgi:hypothetical protein
MRTPACLLAISLALALSCSSASLPSSDAARDAAHEASDDVANDIQSDVLRDAAADSPCTGGQILVYDSPGCGAAAPTPVCAGPTFDGCFIVACGCNGEQIGGCGSYTEPFAHLGPCADGGSAF